MKHIVILGGGTAGTIVAHHLSRALPATEWRIIVVDPDNDHVYQPGLLGLIFNDAEASDLVRSRRALLPREVEFRESSLLHIDATRRRVALSAGDVLPYDFLVIATGVAPAPERIEGLEMGQSNVGEFFSVSGCAHLRHALARSRPGRLVIAVAQARGKAPGAALEFALLADALFTRERSRTAFEIELVTPAVDNFESAPGLHDMLAARHIGLTTGFEIARVDATRRQLAARDGRELHYDLLVVLPPQLGIPAIELSGLGNAGNLVPVNPETLALETVPDAFALGDAAELPAPKLAAAACTQARVVALNLLDRIAGRAPTTLWLDEPSCYVDSGEGRALQLDYRRSAGKPGFEVKVGNETRMRHYAKWVQKAGYWRMTLTGR